MQIDRWSSWKFLRSWSCSCSSSHRQEFYPIGGESPESFLSVFSDDVIQASFNVYNMPGFFFSKSIFL